jgi:SAM-dependent methyltransferase
MDGRRAEVVSDRLHEEAVAGAVAHDVLRRSAPDWRRELAFDRRWSFGLALGGALVYGEAARIFPVQPLEGRDWEEYQFGAVVNFPYAPESEQYAAECAFLLDAAVRLLAERYPSTAVYCLIPEDAARQAAILRTAGFEPQHRTCLESELLTRHGFAPDATIVIFHKPAADDAGFDPLRQLTDDRDDLRIFSNAQTKIRLQPTLKFWGAIQLYTTYSAYPFIPQFLERLQTEFALEPPERLLVAPCAGGDFLRLWPLDIGAPSAAMALDIRSDLLHIARLRRTLPEIDLLNLTLCELLHQVVLRDGAIDRAVHDELAALCATVQATRSEPGLLRFDDPESLPLLARSFDEILQNRAIPDWFFPLKILASADPSARDTNLARADTLAHWLERRGDAIRDAVASLRGLALDAHGIDVREKYRRTNLGMRAQFEGADLTSDVSVTTGPFDLILCWEFIHVFHDRASLGRFIDSLLERLAPGGRLVITNIREPSATPPQEQEWACQHLETEHVSYTPGFIRISASSASGHVPFERRLHAHYPVLVVRRRNE